MYNVSPFYKPVHIIIMVLRILQLVGPCLVESYEYWNINSESKGTVDVISIFYHYIPPLARKSGGSQIFCYFYIAISIFILIIIRISIIYYEKTAKLPMLASNAIILYFGTFHLILHPVVLHLSFEYLAKGLFVKDHIYPLESVIGIPVIVFFCMHNI